MPRAGRDLELLVGLIERVLAGTGVEIRSPERIRGKTTNSLREVDVSIRSKIGSTKIFVMVECRKRSDDKPLEWIEQIATKREDVGADKAIAVFSFGFTKGALNLARAKGIETRTLGEVSPETVLDWVAPGGLKVMFQRSVLTHLHCVLEHENADLIQAQIYDAAGSSSNDQPREIVRKLTGETVKAEVVWTHARNLTPSMMDCLVPNGPRRPVRVTINYTNEQDRYQLVTSVGPLDIAQIVFDAEVWVEASSVPLSDVGSYADSAGEVIARTGRVVAQSKETRFQASFVEADGHLHVAVGVEQTPTQGDVVPEKKKRRSKQKPRRR